MVFAVQINLGRLQNCSYKMVDTKNSDNQILERAGYYETI